MKKNETVNWSFLQVPFSGFRGGKTVGKTGEQQRGILSKR
jgi:hypothetical protein